MADTKISQLPVAGSITGTELVPLVQGGATKQTTVASIVASVGAVTAVTGTAPVVSSGGLTPAISMAAATGSVNGYLTSTDWTTFNNKQPAGSYLVSGGPLGTPSSGTATNLTGLPLTTGVTGTLPIASGGTGVTTSTGSGNTVLSTSPLLITPTLSGAVVGNSAPYLNFNSTTAPAYNSGRFWYDSTQDSLAFNNVVTNNTIHLGQEVQLRVLNSTGSTIAAGNVVYITSTASGQVYPNVALAKADALATAVVMGMANQAIPTGTVGYVTTAGVVAGMSTGTYAVGDILYLSPYSAGQIMNTLPPTGYPVKVGVVSYANSPNGQIYINQANSFVQAANVVGVVAAVNGGTGQSSYAVGDLVYASTTTALSKLADVATGNALISGGVGVAPSYGKVGLTTHVSGTLPTTSGGTNLTSFTANGVVYASSTSALATGSALTFDGSTLSVNGTAGANIFQSNDTSGATSFLRMYADAGNGGPVINTKTGDSFRFANTTTGSSFAGFNELMRISSATGSLGAVGIGYTSLTGVGASGLAVLGNLGIGTSSPSTYSSRLVTVSQAGGAAQSLDAPSGTNTALNWYYNGTAKWTTQVLTTGEFRFFDFTAAATRLTIDTSGNLGLGVTPSAWSGASAKALETAGGSIVNFGTGQFVSAANAIYSSGWLYKNSSLFATQYQQASGQHVWYTAPSGTAGNAITFTQAMTLDASGNLIVGGTVPVTNNGGITATTTVSGSVASTLAMRNAGTANGSGTTLAFRGVTNAGAEADYAYLSMVADDTTAKTGSIRFSTVNGSSPVERARIDSAGNLGLGVTPSAWGTTASRKAIQLGYLGGAAVYTSGSGNTSSAFIHGAYNDGTNWLYATGSVGAGRYEITGANAGSAHAWYVAPGGTAGNPITFTQALTLDASGNLGVGETSIASKLAVTASLPYATVTGSGSGQYGFQLKAGSTDSGGTLVGGLTYNSATGENRILGPQSYNFLTMYAGGSERARIDSSGNLLVGQTATGYQNSKSSYISAGAYIISHSTANISGDTYIGFGYNSGQIGSITQAGTTGVLYNVTSDYRLKDIAGPVTNSGSFIDKLNPVQGSWKADGSRFIGFLAHELQEASETVVGTGVKDGEEMQSIDYSNAELIANLVAEIQSLRKRLAAANI